jgi:CheY-like chemotaxis protein/predicted regulator of Ras-like GTPase activity (Roadblock/LC7/MglB family)
MSEKRILIVDDEESILTILKSSLKKLGSDYQVVTATDGFIALDYLKVNSFDLIVTDYNMASMDGLELLESARYLQPKARVIMMTAYGNNALESEARRLQAYRYLTKPLEINAFRQIVQEALADLVVNKPGILILSDKRYEQVNRMLEQLRAEVGARCVILTDAEGRPIARIGDLEKLPLEEIGSLLGGGLATLSAAGRTMDGDTDAINLAYREGKQEYLYALNVGQQLLMFLVINRNPYSSRLGSVWYHARQAAISLRETLGEEEYAEPEHVFDEGVGQAFDEELDKLFMGNDMY